METDKHTSVHDRFFSLSITILLDLGGIWVQSACWAVAALFLLKDACANHIYALTKPLNFRRAYLTISVPIMLIMSGAISMVCTILWYTPYLASPQLSDP